MGGRVGILCADGVSVVFNLGDKFFEAGVGGNGSFELLVEILDFLLLEGTVGGPEVGQDLKRSDLRETGDLVF